MITERSLPRARACAGADRIGKDLRATDTPPQAAARASQRRAKTAAIRCSAGCRSRREKREERYPERIACARPPLHLKRGRR